MKYWSINQSPTVSFLISIHSVNTKSPNHPQWVSLFTQCPWITHSEFPSFNALSSHTVFQSPTVSFLISMHSVHTKSPNHPQWVFLFTQSPSITHSECPYFNALSSHKVPQWPTVSVLISTNHNSPRVTLLKVRLGLHMVWLDTDPTIHRWTTTHWS